MLYLCGDWTMPTGSRRYLWGLGNLTVKAQPTTILERDMNDPKWGL